MDFGFDRVRQQPEVPTPPSVFFDGTRLGLEGSMLATLAIAIPAGIHIGLSVTLGYAVRLADGLPAQPRPFSLFTFLFASLLAVIALSMLLFFGGSIPTMGYSMGLIAFMLRWIGKHHGREKLTSTIFGAVLGLLVGILEAAVGLLLMNLSLGLGTYATLFRWPAIMTIDGIALLWLTLTPPVHAIAGAQVGYRLGEDLERLLLYRFW
jgi:hypothetical protein